VLLLRLSERRKVRLPMAGEMVPVSPLGIEVQSYHPPPVPRATGDSLPAAVAGALVPGVQHARVVGDLFLEREKSSHIAAMTSGR